MSGDTLLILNLWLIGLTLKMKDSFNKSILILSNLMPKFFNQFLVNVRKHPAHLLHAFQVNTIKSNLLLMYIALIHVYSFYTFIDILNLPTTMMFFLFFWVQTSLFGLYLSIQFILIDLFETLACLYILYFFVITI